ncbi:hypothetical protein HAX54_004219 [Datura stramonium]|uniref:Uncharacterized protein n=1 Tax=Datura stramonium TaxID=4076 RepID=A0ABS8WVT3_DATST|nr:hypothetical protein [Datura stramonium]
MKKIFLSGQQEQNFLKTNLNAKLDKVLVNQMHESRCMDDLFSILKKLGIHFPTQGTGGYGDALLQSVVFVFLHLLWSTSVDQNTIAQRAPREDYFLTPGLIEQVNIKDPKSTTPLEEEHQVIPEAHTQSEIAKSVQALNNEVLEGVNPMEKEHLLVQEAYTESHNVKSVEAMDKQVPEPFTSIEDEHPVVHAAQSNIDPAKSIQAMIDVLQKEQQVQVHSSENAKVKQLKLERLDGISYS